MMRNRYRFLRKSYAMTRMAASIERAIEAGTIKEKESAARWAAAWGLLCGIKTRPVNLRRSEIDDLQAIDDAVDSLGFPEIDFTLGEEHGTSHARPMMAGRDLGAASAAM